MHTEHQDNNHTSRGLPIFSNPRDLKEKIIQHRRYHRRHKQNRIKKKTKELSTEDQSSWKMQKALRNEKTKIPFLQEANSVTE